MQPSKIGADTDPIVEFRQPQAVLVKFAGHRRATVIHVIEYTEIHDHLLP